MRLVSIIRHRQRLLMNQSFYSSQAALKRPSPLSSSSTLSRFGSSEEPAAKRHHPDHYAPGMMSHSFGNGNRSQGGSRQAKRQAQHRQKPRIPSLEGPLRDEQYITSTFPHPGVDIKEPKQLITGSRFKARVSSVVGQVEGIDGPIHRCVSSVF